MSENKSTRTSGGISFCGLLTVAFIVLKLTKVINWSWWWVLSPLWIGFGIAIIFVIIAVAVKTHLRHKYFEDDDE